MSHEPEPDDAEMEALASIVAGFEAMPTEARGRTLRYLVDRYEGRYTTNSRPPAAARPSETRDRS